MILGFVLTALAWTLSGASLSQSQHILSSRPLNGTAASWENMTLCASDCNFNCKIYHIELYQNRSTPCISPPNAWPGDNQWGPYDFQDEVVLAATHLKRRFFSSLNGTCINVTDHFLLPLQQCLGPFGKPRPTGIFGIVGLTK
jgi:hypothetical protein